MVDPSRTMPRRTSRRIDSREYFRYFPKCDFLVASGVFREIRFNVNYSNITLAAGVFRLAHWQWDIRRSAESYRYPFSGKKNADGRWGARKRRKLFAGRLDIATTKLGRETETGSWPPYPY